MKRGSFRLIFCVTCLVGAFWVMPLSARAEDSGVTSVSGMDLPLGAGGVTHMTIQQGTGNVGIGTTTPQNRLQVKGTGGVSVDFATTGRLRTGADNAGGGTGGVWVGPNQFAGSVDATRVGLYNGNWNVTVANNGWVGVGAGNVSPQATLDVSGGVKVGSDNTGCYAAKAGTLSYTNGKLLVCDGSVWKTVGGSNYKIGVTYPGHESQIWCDFYTDCSQTIWPGITAWDEFMTVSTNAGGGYSCTHSQTWCGGCMVSPSCYVSIQKQ